MTLEPGDKTENDSRHVDGWVRGTIILLLLIVVAFIISGKHFTQIDSILTQHEPFRSDFNGPLTQPGLVHISDNVTQILPSKLFTQSELKEGRIPLWNPRIFCGMPHAADLHSQVFSPVDTPFLMFMSVDDALGASALLKLFLAGYFMFLLCVHFKVDRKLALAAGLVYAFSSFGLAWLHFPSFLSTGMYYPLGILLWDKFLIDPAPRTRIRSLLFLGLVMGLMILGGQLQLFANFIIIAIIYGLLSGRIDRTERWKTFVAFLKALAIGLLVGMIQLLPAIELMLHSTRTLGGFNFFADFGLFVNEPRLALSVMGNFLEKVITLAFPFGWGELFPTNAQPFPEAVIFVGITTFICFMSAWKSKPSGLDNFLIRFILACIVINIFSLIINSVFSFVGILEFLNPGRCAMAAAVLFMPVLAVRYVHNSTEQEGNIESPARNLYVQSALLLLITITIGAVSMTVIQTAASGSLELTKSVVCLFYIAELITIALLIRGLRGRPSGSKRDEIRELFANALIAESLILALVISFPSATLTVEDIQTNSLSQILAKEDEPFRVVRYQAACDSDFDQPHMLVKKRSPILKPNEGMLLGIDDFQGYNSLNPRGFSEYVKSIDERLFLNLRGSIDLFSPGQVEAEQLDDANVVFILSQEVLENSNLTEVIDSPIMVYRRNGAKPRVWLESGKDTGSVTIEEYNPGSISLSVNSPESTSLVFTENMFPGWRAKIDGVDAKVAKYGKTPFMSVELDAGDHEVLFQYHPWTLPVGFLLTVLGVVLAVFPLLMLSGRASSAPRMESSTHDDIS